MAWENYSLSPILKTGIYNGNWESNIIRPTTTSDTTTLFGHSSDFDFSDADAYDLSNGTSELPTGKFYGDEHNYLMRNSNSVIQIYYNDTLIGRLPFSLVYVNRYTIYAGINEELHQAKLFGIAWNSDTSVNPNVYFGSFMDAEQSPTYPSYYEKLYTILKSQVPPITYNWQSVPSIIGKNGILQPLSTLVNINDGNPVSGASASDVNIIPASVVSGMIQTGASDVIVSFEIPQLTSGTYDSIKLVGKRGGIPRSKTDGEFIETLSDSDTSKTLTGLTKGYTYWFVIFAEDSKGSSSESDPYPYETGEGESVAFFEIDLGQGGKDIVRYDATKTIGGHKQGELYGSYTISNDELNASHNISWAYDGSENPKSIPANCTLTFEYDTYFTSGEGYLDWYIVDANGDEQIYWCFDTQYAFQSNKWYNCKTVAKVENGKITRYKFVLDDVELSCGTANIKMPCTDASDSVGIEDIHFRLTRPTKMKNISIYYDFSTYTDGSGGGGSGGSGASGSNPVS